MEEQETQIVVGSEQGLALSLHAKYLQDRKILGSPITTLAKMRGVNAKQVYNVLLPSLAQRDLGEAIRFAEVGLRYAALVDKNRLREEIGEEFIVSMDMIMNIVDDGLASKENWIKRKAISLHGELIDEAAEKTRFVETILAEQKCEMVLNSLNRIGQIEEEVLVFEENNGRYECVNTVEMQVRESSDRMETAG
jgi:hypothetical protein